MEEGQMDQTKSGTASYILFYHTGKENWVRCSKVINGQYAVGGSKYYYPRYLVPYLCNLIAVRGFTNYSKLEFK